MTITHQRHNPSYFSSSAFDDAEGLREDARHSAIPVDRMSPAASGALVGLGAGMLALGLVNLLRLEAFTSYLQHVADQRGVAVGVSYAVAYGTAAAAGAIVGAAFAVVTRYLRKWGALVIWGTVFFTSLTMLVLAATSVFGHAVAPTLAGPILGAGALFGALVSFSLPIRRVR